jgi:hypothetical protein
MAATSQNPSHRRIESYLEGVRTQNGIYTNLPFVSASTGGSSFAGTLTVGGLVNTGTNTGSLSSVVALTGTTTVTQAQSGTTFLLNAAAGFTTTLPTVPVIGTHYTFVVTTSVTSSTLKIITGTAAQLLQGVITSATTTASVFESVIGTSNISVAMNGSTTGGLVGSQFEFTCLSATLWQVFGTNFTSGTTATPFATS